MIRTRLALLNFVADQISELPAWIASMNDAQVVEQLRSVEIVRGCSGEYLDLLVRVTRARLECVDD